jgi:CHAD domain-containing protein
MAEGKWISDLTAHTPLADAARHVLTVRLEVVRDHLPRALHEADKDPEHVHQLRVGTRRARAALDIFACCLPAKAYKKAKKTLRNIRRTAGEARDWDVFLASLAEWIPKQGPRHRAGLDFLSGYALARRQLAQEHLLEAGAGLPFTFDRFVSETVAAVHKPHDDHQRTLLDLARPLLSGLLQELDQAASRDLGDYAQLHQVRILGKRLRYAMEIFADCFGPSFRERLYPAVEEMQEVLGHANDSHVACERLTAIEHWLHALLPQEWKRLKTGIEGLRRYHKERLPQQRKHFEAWWQRWQASGGEAAFFALLKPAPPVVPSSPAPPPPGAKPRTRVHAGRAGPR